VSTYVVKRLSDGLVCLTVTHISCIPDARDLASLYGAGYVLLENGRKTSATRRKELLALRANARKEN